VREDADKVKEEAEHDVDHLIGKESKLADRPGVLVGSAAGVGVVLGALSSRAPRPRVPVPGRNGSKPQKNAYGGYGPYPGERSRTERLIGAATGGATAPLASRLDQLISEVWESFRSGFQDPEAPRAGANSSGIGEATQRAMARGEHPREGQTTYLTREEIGPYNSDPRLDGDPEGAREILHEAEVEDFDPRSNLGGTVGVQGEGLLMPRTPAPLEQEERSERRTGQ
jgi:hypothetical protein